MDIEGPVVVARKGQARIERGHPWVFRTDVVKDGGARRARWCGSRTCAGAARLRLLVVELRDPAAHARARRGPPGAFLRDRIERALRWRETVAAGAEAYRVVHGEGDGLPSLVVDRYGDYLALQTLSQGTERAKPEIVAALVDLLKPAGHRRAQRPAGANARGPASRPSRCSTARCPRSSR